VLCASFVALGFQQVTEPTTNRVKITGYSYSRLCIFVSFAITRDEWRSDYFCTKTITRPILSSDFKKMHVFVFKWFLEVARIAISVDFCYSITRVETALQLRLRNPKLCHKVFKEKRESFSCLPHEIHVSSCSKGSLVHHFWG
jgi:hypothetical protein